MYHFAPWQSRSFKAHASCSDGGAGNDPEK